MNNDAMAILIRVSWHARARIQVRCTPRSETECTFVQQSVHLYTGQTSIEGLQEPHRPRLLLFLFLILPLYQTLDGNCQSLSVAITLASWPTWPPGTDSYLPITLR